MTTYAAGPLVNIPSGPFLDERGNLSPAWRLWLLNPNVQSINVGTAIQIGSGGTGTSGGPIPTKLNPVLTGDVSSAGGTTEVVLATVNTAPGSYGTAKHVAGVTVNEKGLVTAAADVPISGSDGDFAVGRSLSVSLDASVVGKFGCNAATAQGPYVSGGAVAGTGSTNVAPYGFTTAAQADGIVTLLNNIRAALVAVGIMS
jgi:hypothetical protein